MDLLLALDIHEGPDALLDEAVRWARRLDARIDVIYVDEFVRRTTYLHDPVLDAQREKVTATNQAKLQAVVALLPEDVRGAGLMRSGDAHEAIAEAAKQHDAVLIGTHGRGALAKALLGSVADRVVRMADCPVVVLRPSDDQSDGPFRLLLAVDIHEADVDEVVAKGVHWATALGATLDLTWVDEYEYAAYRIRDAKIRQIVLDQWARARSADLTDLERLSALVPEEIRGKAWRIDGRAARELVTAAEDYDAVLIATHGRKGLQHFFLGSVAERVVRSASTTVIVLRLPVPDGETS